jgi:hypothetical protein
MGGDEMTVLVGAISESGEVAIASDSMQWSESGERSDGPWKTLRINDRCAMGFSGNGTYAGQIAAVLMGKREWAEEAGEVDLLRRIEDAGIRRDEWPCAGVCAILKGVLFDFAKTKKERTGKLPNVDVVFVGREDGQAYLRAWVPSAQAEYLWVTREVEGPRFDEANVLMFGPAKLEEPKEITKDVSIPFADRILAICELYAERFPEKVNRDFWIRTDGSSFARISLGTGQH